MAADAAALFWVAAAGSWLIAPTMAVSGCLSYVEPIHHFANNSSAASTRLLLGPLFIHFLARLCVHSVEMSWLRRGLHIWKRGQLNRGGEL